MPEWFQRTAKQVIVVLDQAGFHDERGIHLPEGIHLLDLPAYSAELQPAEKLWPLSNEGVANQHFETIEDLEEAQSIRCQILSQIQPQIQGACFFEWWPLIQNNLS